MWNARPHSWGARMFPVERVVLSNAVFEPPRRRNKHRQSPNALIATIALAGVFTVALASADWLELLEIFL